MRLSQVVALGHGVGRSRLVDVYVHPEVLAGGPYGGRAGHSPKPLQHWLDDAVPDGGQCEDGRLVPGWVGLAEQLEGHLAISLDHGLHSCLLARVCD